MLNKSGKWEGSPESMEYRPGAGSFVTLLVISAVGIILVGFLFWYVPTKGLGNIHPLLPLATGVVLLAGGLAIFIGALLISAAAMNRDASRRGISGRIGTALLSSRLLRWMLVKVFLPLMCMAGGILRIPRINIERAFIDINNQMVRLMGRFVRPEKLLILMPHCIQYDDCRIKVTRNVKNCAGCGKCEIGDLVGLTEEFGISLFISTGGTVARRKVVEDRPDAVIAVACERDLTSGLQDAYPLPVYAIVNKRPRGYCLETGVELTEVRQAILDLVVSPL